MVKVRFEILEFTAHTHRHNSVLVLSVGSSQSLATVPSLKRHLWDLYPSVKHSFIMFLLLSSPLAGFPVSKPDFISKMESDRDQELKFRDPQNSGERKAPRDMGKISAFSGSLSGSRGTLGFLLSKKITRFNKQLFKIPTSFLL